MTTIKKSHSSTTSSSSENKRIHDLKSVRTDVKILIDLIESGHRFNPEELPRIVKQIEGSLLILDKEIQLVQTASENK
jgi:hypothetical protein